MSQLRRLGGLGLGVTRDLTLHPLDQGALRERLVDVLHGGRVVNVQGEAFLARLARARAVYASCLGPAVTGVGPGDEPVAPALCAALGTLLCFAQPYWYERASGLAVIAEELEPSLAPFLRDATEALAAALPTLPARALGKGGGTYLRADDIEPFRALLRARGAGIRAGLERRGEFTYFAALVEATAFCADAGMGLLELSGICTLREAPNPKLRRAFFDRAEGPQPVAAPPDPEPPSGLGGAVRAAQQALAVGDAATAADRLSTALAEAPEVGNEAAGALGLLAEALTAAGRPEGALAAARAATLADPDDLDLALALVRLQLEQGADPEPIVRALKDRLRVLDASLDPDDWAWADDADAVAELAEPAAVAELLGMIGGAYEAMGFPDHAAHAREQAAKVDPV
jgi:tetratricopeptide (TPR) repeat protein